MRAWFKKLNELRIKLLYVAKHYDELVGRIDALYRRQQQVENHVDGAVQVIRERTDWHVDVTPHPRGAPHQVIMIGVYRGQDYIEIFNLPPDDFRGLVMRCKDITRYAKRGVVDAMPEMRMILNRET